METTMAIFTYLREIISSGKLTRVITKYVETIKTVTIMANAGHCANQCPAGPNASIAGMNTAQKNRSETKTDFLSVYFIPQNYNIPFYQASGNGRS